MARRPSPFLGSVFTDTDESPGIPEKTLLLAVLYRALKDLSDVGFIRQDAIKWFEGEHSSNFKKGMKFTFEDCIDYLNLNSTKLTSITARVNRARDCYGKCTSERETSGESYLPLPTRVRLVTNSKTDPTIFRYRRYIGHNLRRAS
jgi:hypothetical protein